MATTTTATDTTTDALVKFVRDDVNRDGRRDGIYAAYVAAHEVTLDTVAAHVKRLTEAAYPGVTPSNKDNAKAIQHKAKNFQNKVRNGLNSTLGKGAKTAEPGVIRISLSGEGGGTVTLREGQPGYTEALALIRAGVLAEAA